MKMNIYIDDKDTNPGATYNISLLTNADVNQLVHDGECKEVIVHDVLNYINHGAVNDFINLVINKVRKGGTVSFVGNSLITILKAAQNKELDINEFNKLMFGVQETWELKKGIVEKDSIIKNLQGRGFKILANRINPELYQFYIQAERV